MFAIHETKELGATATLVSARLAFCRLMQQQAVNIATKLSLASALRELLSCALRQADRFPVSPPFICPSAGKRHAAFVHFVWPSRERIVRSHKNLMLPLLCSHTCRAGYVPKGNGVCPSRS